MLNYTNLNCPEIMELFQFFVINHGELLPNGFPSTENMALAAYPLAILHYQCMLAYYYQEGEYEEICSKVFGIHQLGEVLLDWSLSTLEDDELVKGPIRQAEITLGLPIPTYQELLIHMDAVDCVYDCVLIARWCKKQKEIRKQLLADALLTCHVCLNDDNDFDFMVALVPCGHGLCRECLERLNKISKRTQLATGRQGGRTVLNHTGRGGHLFPFSCPLCRCEPTSIINVRFNRSAKNNGE